MFGLFDAVLDLGVNVVKVAAAPIAVVAEVANAVVSPVAETAEEMVRSVSESLR